MLEEEVSFEFGCLRSAALATGSFTGPLAAGLGGGLGGSGPLRGGIAVVGLLDRGGEEGGRGGGGGVGGGRGGFAPTSPLL